MPYTIFHDKLGSTAEIQAYAFPKKAKMIRALQNILDRSIFNATQSQSGLVYLFSMNDQFGQNYSVVHHNPLHVMEFARHNINRQNKKFWLFEFNSYEDALPVFLGLNESNPHCYDPDSENETKSMFRIVDAMDSQDFSQLNPSELDRAIQEATKMEEYELCNLIHQEIKSRQCH